jgi:hypothetical protein
MKMLYKIAKNFLVKHIAEQAHKSGNNANQILACYLEPHSLTVNRFTKREIFRRLLSSAQNSGRLRNIIGGDDGLGRLAASLMNFDSRKLSRSFREDGEALFRHIRPEFNLNQVNEASNGLLPRYSRTILSASGFMNQFPNDDIFYEWADSLYENEHSRPALPMLIQSEIEGMGYALACDFLKELGYDKYGKPDVHLKEIFSGIGLCRPNDYMVQKEISRIAESVGVSAFNVDKIFWLIGSGYLYKHKQIGNRGKIGSTKQSFIRYFNDKFYIKNGLFDTA